jgi:hypothetical protein
MSESLFLVTEPAITGQDDRDPEQAQWVAPSWDEIVRAHSGRVYRLAYRLTGNQHDAEDLTQEVFVRVFRSLASYTPGTFEGWLHRITTNLFLDGARHRPLRPGMTATSTGTSRRRCRRCRRITGRRWCCATSRGSPTRRSRPRWA